jgi:hypothetical protein
MRLVAVRRPSMARGFGLLTTGQFTWLRDHVGATGRQIGPTTMLPRMAPRKASSLDSRSRVHLPQPALGEITTLLRVTVTSFIPFRAHKETFRLRRPTPAELRTRKT